MSPQMIKEWSKSYRIFPRDNIQSHERIKSPKFVASYEREECPPAMSLLLGWEYARIWQRERDDFIQKRKNSEKQKKIGNDFKHWLLKRTPKAKKPSCNI